MEDSMRKLLGVSCVLVVLTWAMTASSSPPVGVAPTLISRGTYEPFKVKTDHHSAVDFEAKAKSDFDIVVRRHDYAPRGSTGWHTHPGPVLITVLQGKLTFYEYDDPTCTPKVVTAGQGYVDDGHGHIGVNENDEPAVDVSVILAPVGSAFRSELPAPGPHCRF
jgi:cupin domain